MIWFIILLHIMVFRKIHLLNGSFELIGSDSKSSVINHHLPILPDGKNNPFFDTWFSSMKKSSQLNVVGRFLRRFVWQQFILRTWQTYFPFFKTMLISKVISIFLVFASAFYEIDSTKWNSLSTKEIIKFYIRVKLCQVKTCEKCAKLINIKTKNKIIKVKNGCHRFLNNVGANYKLFFMCVLTF